MPWIDWISEDSASGPLKRLFDHLRGPHGVAHILKIHSLNPASLNRRYAYYRHIMFGPSGLSRVERENDRSCRVQHQRLLLLNSASRGGAP